MFLTRPTPNRIVVRLFRAWLCRTGETEGEGLRVSPSRYREVILLLQQTLAGERRSTTCDPKIGRRRQDGRPKSTAPPSRQPSCPQQHRGPAAGQHPYRSEAGGRAIQAKARLHPSHGPTAFPDRPDQSSPHGRQPTTEGRESSPPRLPIKGRSADERPAPPEPAGNQPPGSQRPHEGRHGWPAVGVGQGRGKVCLHRLSSASQQVAAIAVAAAARRDPSRSRPAPAWPRRGSWDL